MTTLTIMKARIATELRRSNITSQIADAIATAVEAYEDRRFYFNETRAFTFVTVADQEFYSSSDDPDLGNILKFDYIKLMVGDQPYTLKPATPEHIENLSQNGTSTGQPLAYCWYGEQLRLYPIPSIVYTVRIGAKKKVAAPATDGEADNPWMVKAERLIRSRAKWELATHVLRDPKLAGDMETAILEALSQLKGRTNDLTQQGEWAVTPTQF